jgi:hypothetical protein
VVPDLILHGRPVETFFDLLGRNENDMTAALGLGLSRSGPLLRRFVCRLAPEASLDGGFVIELQEHDEVDRGFTDIEIRSDDLHVIVEAKRGWDPPSQYQLLRYEARFAKVGLPRQRVVILTQNGADSVVRHRLGSWRPAEPIGVEVVGWSDIVQLARAAGHEGAHADRRIANELAAYLREVADMRDTESNRVFVVSLGASAWPGWDHDLTPIAILERFNRYSFPATGKNYPKTPPNYIAFRYWGRLQSIHHVDDYTIVDRPRPHIPGAPDIGWEQPTFMLTLGPPMRPDHEVRTGSGIIRSGRVWVDIDLLLTSQTITEAAELSRARRGGVR